MIAVSAGEAGGASTAVLFDIDGTLVDSNYLHVEAWSHALSDLEFPVDSTRIHHAIGMDSGKLLARLVGDDEADRSGERLKELHTKYYEQLAPRLRAFGSARDLLREVGGRGARVVLATSAPEGELSMLRSTLNADDLVFAMTSADDVETAKPAPDIVAVALEKAGTAASDAFFVGDSTYDMIAARKAGVRCVGVLTGGLAAPDLLAAGAEVVYDDVTELLERLDDSPLAELWAPR